MRKYIRVWQFKDAPKKYKNLSTNGGDEDWVAEVPKGMVGKNEYLEWSWLGSTGFDTCQEPQKIEAGKFVIYIGSHA